MTRVLAIENGDERFFWCALVGNKLRVQLVHDVSSLGGTMQEERMIRADAAEKYLGIRDNTDENVRFFEGNILLCCKARNISVHRNEHCLKTPRNITAIFLDVGAKHFKMTRDGVE